MVASIPIELLKAAPLLGQTFRNKPSFDNIQYDLTQDVDRSQEEIISLFNKILAFRDTLATKEQRAICFVALGDFCFRNMKFFDIVYAYEAFLDMMLAVYDIVKLFGIDKEHVPYRRWCNRLNIP